MWRLLRYRRCNMLHYSVVQSAIRSHCRRVTHPIIIIAPFVYENVGALSSERQLQAEEEEDEEEGKTPSACFCASTPTTPTRPPARSLAARRMRRVCMPPPPPSLPSCVCPSARLCCDSARLRLTASGRVPEGEEKRMPFESPLLFSSLKTGGGRGERAAAGGRHFHGQSRSVFVLFFLLAERLSVRLEERMVRCRARMMIGASEVGNILDACCRRYRSRLAGGWPPGSRLHVRCPLVSL